MPDVFMYTSKGYVAVEQDDYEPPPPEYDCSDCGVRFIYPAQDGLCRDICPDCGSINITEVDPDDYGAELESEFPIYYDAQGSEHAEF